MAREIFRHVPPRLAGLKVYCEACGSEIKIPFFEKTKEKLKPVIPLDHHPVTNNVKWVLISQ